MKETLTSDISFSAISAGFVAVLVGFASSVAIVFQAAQAAGATQPMIVSWIIALGIGMGLTCIGLSYYYKVPILTAWSTPGAALLVTALNGVTINQAIGVFIFSGLLTFALGLSGWFERLTKRIPLPLASAMLAGILLQFGLSIFTSLQSDPMLVSVMLVTYLLAKRLAPRYAIIIVLIIGCIAGLATGQLSFSQIQFKTALPVWVTPQWDIASMLGIGIPLFIVTMTSQNIPGVATLRSSGYNNFGLSSVISWTGFTSVVLAPLGGFCFNLAAITAAICAGPEAHQQKNKRYIAGIAAGFFYLLTGIGGATLVTLFTAFPKALIATLAGLALLSTIGNSLLTATKDPDYRDAALVTFLVTVSGVSFFDIASAFWGIMAGVLLLAFTSAKHNPQQFK